MKALECLETENDLIRLLLDRERSGEVYPKVTRIAGKRIAPDIDVLKVERPYQRQPVPTGYECKVLNPKRNVLGPVYAGLGQVLCYSQYGLDRAWLALGVPAEVSAEMESKLNEIIAFLRESRVLPRHVGLRSIREGQAYFSDDIEPGGTFWTLSHSARYMRDSLLRGELVYSKKMKGAS